MHASKVMVVATVLAGLLASQGPKPGVTVDWSKVEQRIAWHGTWSGALLAAKATGRPILLVFAAPQCGSVPGMW